jgi:beta-lactam-binding protein with PASTA domain
LNLAVDHLAVATFNKIVRCKVPKVVGLTLKKARTRIVRAHCRVGKVTKRFTTRRKKGRVLSQKPKPSRLLAAGARVTLVVGKGPAPVAVSPRPKAATYCDGAGPA